MVNVALVLRRTPETPPGVNPERPEDIIFLVDPAASFATEADAFSAVEQRRGLLKEAGYDVEQVVSFDVK